MRSQDDDVRFTNEPCPDCKKDGGPTGYLVKPDCPQCLGSGRKRVSESFVNMVRRDFH